MSGNAAGGKKEQGVLMERSERKLEAKAISRSLLGEGKAAVRITKIKREFDPGSESTLAARLTHASRTRKAPSGAEYSGARVSNTWIPTFEWGITLGN